MVFVVEVDPSPKVFGGIGLVDDEFGGISTDGVDGLFDGGESISRSRGVWERSFGSHKDCSRCEFGGGYGDEYGVRFRSRILHQKCDSDLYTHLYTFGKTS